MSERRSSRSRNTVNYIGFDDESDDDFANVSPNPAKKVKSSKTGDPTSKKSKKSAKDCNRSIDVEVIDNTLKTHNSNKARRAPLSEKIYKRELQEALELSLLETGESQDVLNHNKDNNELQPEPLLLASDLGGIINQQSSYSAHVHTEESHPQKPTTNTAPSLGYIPGTIVLDDSIELLEEINEESCSKKQVRQKSSRGQAAKKPRTVDSDGDSSDESDFIPTADSDEDEASGSDFIAEMSDRETSKQDDISAMKEKAKLTKSKMNATNVKTSSKGVNKRATRAPQKHQETASKPNGTKTTSSVHISSKTSTKTHSSNQLCQKVPSSLVSQWKPPSRASPNKISLTMVKSPSSGLRIGLSRNQRVKPLHPSVGIV